MMLLFQQDFEACTQALHRMGYSNPQLTAARGTSAGGLIVGAVCNRSPGLFKAAILRVGLRFYFGLTWQCYYWPWVLLVMTSVLIIKPMPICITPVCQKKSNHWKHLRSIEWLTFWCCFQFLWCFQLHVFFGQIICIDNIHVCFWLV